MSAPKRIRWNRFDLAPFPPNTKLITRPGKFSNPFTIASCLENGFADNEEGARRTCVQAFDAWLDGEQPYAGFEPERRARLLTGLPELAGYNLACSCPEGGPCHGDSLLRRAAQVES